MSKFRLAYKNMSTNIYTNAYKALDKSYHPI